MTSTRAKPSDRLTVREARERRGLSQVETAHRLGVSEPTYRKYERNSELMSLKMAYKLADVLGLEWTDLALYDPDSDTR